MGRLPEISPDRVLALTQDLVAINSVNPDLVPGGAGEREAARYVAEFFERAGLETILDEVRPGRPNVVARVRGRRPGPTLLVVGHLDTVGVESMTAPFARRFENGRIYGRGAQDIKSGVAAMMAAAEALSKTGLDRGECIFAGVIDEEYASIGTEHLVRKVAADAAVVLEPTDLEIVVAHKGFVWSEIRTHGRAAHGSRPAEGEDAIRRMGYVLTELDRLEARLRTRPAHPRLGHGSLHASIIQGGQEWSSYPALCRLQVERRTLPGETSDDVSRELKEVIAAASRAVPGLRADVEESFAREAYEIAEDAPIVRIAGEAARAVTGRARLGGMTGWTDTAILAQAGIPGVVFGPGGQGLHSVEEWVPLADVVACAQVLVLIALGFIEAKK